jgi:L-amino acid N-acyltransferase YncA
MPEARLAALDVDKCAMNWTDSLNQNQIVWVATVDEQIVGFVSGGKNRIQSDCETGLGNVCECELAVIYILKAFHKMGIGRALFDRFVKQMQAEGFQTMVVWVAELNPSTGYYARMGGELIDRKFMSVCGQYVPEVAYRFDITKYY